MQVLVWATPQGEMGEEEREQLTTEMNNLCAGVRAVCNTLVVDSINCRSSNIHSANKYSSGEDCQDENRSLGHGEIPGEGPL